MMADEIELKLDAPASAAARLAKVPWLQKLIAAPARRRRIVSVYFDTRSDKLRAAGISLRVRHVGDKTVQTVKRDPKGADGAFSRQEWEWEITGDKPELALAKHTPLAQFNLKKLRRKLRPVFETDVLRAALRINHRDNDLELAIDRGEVRAGRRSAPISEIELEVKRGDAVEVVGLARRIASETAAGYGAMSKAERGYALNAGERRQPVFADAIVLDPATSAGQAFQAVGFSCLHHFAANRDAVGHGDPEGVHQMRVGLRRFRAAMSFFKTLIAQPDTEPIKRELKWLTQQLGPARDTDVLLKDGIKPLQHEEPKAHEVAALQREIEQRRRAAFVRAKAAVESERYRKLGLDTALWLAGGTWFTSADPLIAARRGIPIANLAAGELSRRARKILKRAKKLDTLDARRRHKLRIAIKKLRYACKFFASVYQGRKAEARRLKLARASKGIQSALGKLNDIQVHDRLAHRLARTRPALTKQPEKAFAAGLLTGKEHARAAAILGDALKAASKLRKLTPFWH
jgi:inorganic triphosphatase YgiF